MVPKCKSSDAGNLDMSKRSRKVLPLSKKVKILDLVREGKKKNMGKLLRPMVRKYLSIKLRGRKKAFMLVLL